MPRWATIKQVAEYLHCAESTVYNAVSQGKPLGKLFVHVEGVKRLADLDEVDALLKAGHEPNA